jgi:hypothetical protein
MVRLRRWSSEGSAAGAGSQLDDEVTVVVSEQRFPGGS